MLSSICDGDTLGYCTDCIGPLVKINTESHNSASTHEIWLILAFSNQPTTPVLYIGPQLRLTGSNLIPRFASRISPRTLSLNDWLWRRSASGPGCCFFNQTASIMINGTDGIGILCFISCTLPRNCQNEHSRSDDVVVDAQYPIQRHLPSVVSRQCLYPIDDIIVRDRHIAHLSGSNQGCFTM
ncbi:hypothetical protein BDV25DRAFT_148744 [Aspergillus avenaceus]|uniref:Uncharacterized protein n=1 Tax=Aspergillus avenaceus TaxID=36643 RepID=A0A5N6U6L0_ASPAV|nr:hypothetical protein BDV25DRAFT_148744 [Aspergillus avenaceus]